MVPAGQGIQGPSPLENVPARQSVQPLCVELAVWPAPQAWHSHEPAEEYSKEGQTWQLPSSEENSPAEHSTHATPAVSASKPQPQGVHWCAPSIGATEPAGHGVHGPSPGEKVPTGQGSQASWSSLAWEPAGQSMQLHAWSPEYWVEGQS